MLDEFLERWTEAVRRTLTVGIGASLGVLCMFYSVRWVISHVASVTMATAAGAAAVAGGIWYAYARLKRARQAAEEAENEEDKELESSEEEAESSSPTTVMKWIDGAPTRFPAVVQKLSGRLDHVAEASDVNPSVCRRWLYPSEDLAIRICDDEPPKETLFVAYYPTRTRIRRRGTIRSLRDDMGSFTLEKDPWGNMKAFLVLPEPTRRR